MKRINKKIVVWNVTNKCNLNCEFCFGSEKNANAFNKQQGFEMIDKFKKEGAEKLVFTGGEPLQRKDLVDLIRYAKEKGIYTILHTNGLLLTKDKLKILAKYLDQINLPIDDSADFTLISNADRVLITEKRMRERGVFGKVKKILDWMKDYPKIKIVISTVVTKLNKDCIIKIAKVLPEYIYKWRVFQFKPQGRAKMFEKKYKVSDEEFRKIRKGLGKLKTDFEIQFVGKNDEFYGSYVEV